MMGTSATQAIVAALVAFFTAGAGAHSIMTNDPVLEFERRVAAYMRLHEETEAGVPSLRTGSTGQEIGDAVEAMANGMRAARADAKTGEIITAEIADFFRTNISIALLRKGIAAGNLAVAINDERPCTTIVLAVNERFVFFAMTPPLILSVLPTLPGELQYRFVGSSLVLVDTHSTLIVDILPRALAVD